MTKAFEYIDSDDALAGIVEQFKSRPVVALDTEFARSHTYYPEIGLVQLYDGEDCYLIDPLALENLDALGELLAAPNVIKVLHACSEDLEVLQYAVDATPSPLFDTQIASAALGLNFSVSYQTLVEHFLGIAIAKDETRSDWLKRPLTDAQLEYAALDVIHLLEVYHKQREQLQAAGKAHWVEEECAHLGDDISITTPPDTVYFKVKSAARMNPAELNRLQALCAWREREARRLNVPRNRVVEEKALVAIVRANVRDKAGLQDVAGMTPRQVRKFGDEILFLLSEARLVPAQDFPPPLPEGGAPVSNDRVKMLKRVVQDRADSLKVAPELLARRRHLEQLVRSGDTAGEFRLPGALTGWREDVIGRYLLEALQDA